jgi:hypothetical protein
VAEVMMLFWCGRSRRVHVREGEKEGQREFD